MSDLSIRKDFIEGTYEVFSTLFNEGKTPDDGIQFFPYVDGEENIYEEVPHKVYGKPITLICHINEDSASQDTDIKAQKRSGIFTVPIKSLNENGIANMSKEVVSELKKGIIKYKDVYYEIDLIQGKTFVENIYLFWDFKCTEIFDIGNLNIKIEEEPETLSLKMEEE